MLLCVLFIVEYQFIMETSFSLEIGLFSQTATCHLIMFIDASWSRSTCFCYVISLETSNDDILGPSHYILIDFK